MPVLPLYDEPLSDEAKPDQPFSDEPKPDHAQLLVNRFHNSVRESMPGIIFSERDSPNMDMPALVIWVLEDCSKIPGIPYFFDVYRKLEKVLENDGLGDHPNHHVIIVDQEVDSKEFSQSFLDLRQEYMSCCINLDILLPHQSRDCRRQKWGKECKI